MERITIIIKNVVKADRVRLRFRIGEGRNVQIYHKSDIYTTSKDLEKFNIDGSVKPRISIYDRDLASAISEEIAVIKEVYATMKKKRMSLSSKNFAKMIAAKKLQIERENRGGDAFLPLFAQYVDDSYRDGVIGDSRYKHDKGTIRKITRFLQIKNETDITVQEFDDALLLEFRRFVQDEYLYVDEYPSVYLSLSDREIPKTRRKMNTLANEMQVLKSFFMLMEDMECIHRSPFRKLGQERRKLIIRKKYDDPVFLRKDEFDILRNLSVPEELEQTRQAFLLHCALGCRIGDFQSMTMDNVGVSEDGIPYVHYLPQKTSRKQKSNSETVTPLVKYALDIVKETAMNFPVLQYASGKSGYNVKIKQLLELAGIDRKVTLFDEETGTNKYVPLYSVSSSKLARATHVDMMSKVQINLYAAGLHSIGSDAVNRYTKMELKDRFLLMNVAFGEPDFRVNDQLDYLQIVTINQ